LTLAVVMYKYLENFVSSYIWYRCYCHTDEKSEMASFSSFTTRLFDVEKQKVVKKENELKAKYVYIHVYIYTYRITVNHNIVL
jgi:hypothetical protein